MWIARIDRLPSGHGSSSFDISAYLARWFVGTSRLSGNPPPRLFNIAASLLIDTKVFVTASISLLKLALVYGIEICGFKQLLPGAFGVQVPPQSVWARSTVTRRGRHRWREQSIKVV